MKTSVIRYRVADFLKQYPPFDVLTENELLELAGTGRVTFHQSDEYLFQKGQAKDALVRVIQQGKVEIVEERSDGEHIRDVLGEGDILGLDRSFRNEPYPFAARTASDVILYSLDGAAFEELVRKNEKMSRYVAAHFPVKEKTWLDAAPPPVELLDPADTPPGAPATTSGRDAGDLFIQMLRARTNCLRLDCGVLSDRTLALASGRNPVALMQATLHARSKRELELLVRYRDELIAAALAAPEEVDRCATLATLLDTAWIETLTRLAQAEVSGGAPPAPFCWIQFGRGGRAECLAFEPPTLGIIYADPGDADSISVSEYFSALLAAAGQTGSWSRSLTGWKQYFGELIRDPILSGIFLSRSMFDFRPISTSGLLAAELQGFIAAEIASADIFIPVLANDTLGNLPPMTFFRGLVVALDGEERSTLNIESYALQPIEDAARVFALSAGQVWSSGTLDRLALAGDTTDDAREAFRVAAYHRAKASFRGAGFDLDPSALSKYEQRQLKTTFQSIRRLLEYTASHFGAATQL